MKVNHLLPLLPVVLYLGCVNLDRPQGLNVCSVDGGCSEVNPASTGGVSGGASEVGGDEVKRGDDAIATGGSDSASVGGDREIGQVTDSGTDGPVGSGGTAGVGGNVLLDAATGTGGATGSGGTAASTGGAAGSGGNTSTDAGPHGDSAALLVDGAAPDGSIGVDAATGSGDVASGDTATGGATGADSRPSSGGTTGTGGSTGAGGSSGTNCGAVPSKVSPTFSFAAGLGTLSMAPNTASGTKLTFVTTGPPANPGLCSPSAGCAALSLSYAAGATAYNAFALAVEEFAPAINLVGSTVTFSLAVDNPGTTQVPVQIQAYTQGDLAANYAWTQPVTVGGASLAFYAAASGFNDLVLPVTNYVSTTGTYCAAVTSALGIQLQNTAAITSGNAGTVTVYISKIKITPPG